MESQQANTLHKAAKRYFLQNKIYVAKLDAKYIDDLVDMQGIAQQNFLFAKFNL